MSQYVQGVAEAVVSLELWWTDLLWGLAGALASWLGEPQSPSGKTFPGYLLGVWQDSAPVYSAVIGGFCGVSSVGDILLQLLQHRPAINGF